MITKTSLKHPKVQKRVVAAVLNVIKNGYAADHVRHVSDERAYLAVRADREAKRLYVVDGQGRDVTKAVNSVLKDFVTSKRK